jgi:putative endonuclease
MRGLLARLLSPFRRRKLPAHLALGRWGEEQAAKALRREGLAILARNVRFGPREELDAVAYEKETETLVFVETRTRASEAFVRPIETVDQKKRTHVSRAAKSWLRRLRRKPKHFRFDVVEVVGTPDSPTPPVIRHVRNVWTLPGSSRPDW